MAEHPLSTVFAQRRNLANPAFLRMLADVARFNRAARRVAADGVEGDLTLGEFLASGRWSRQLLDGYLVPLGSAIWSADPRSFADIPLITFARFFDNHGLLRLGDRPRWRTIEGGSARYVDAILRPAARARAVRRRDREGRPAPADGDGRAPDGGRGPAGVRPRGHRHPQRPGPAAPGRPDAGGAGDPRAPSATSPTGPPSTPTGDSCPGTGGRGRAGTTTARPTTGARWPSPTP